VPVHTAVCKSRPVGALVVLVAVQLSVAGLYLAPVLKKFPMKSLPPQTIIALPVQIAVWFCRPEGALVVVVAAHVSVVGLYLAPVFTTLKKSFPPQTTISLPVQTIV
jgi:hypothetical protein